MACSRRTERKLSEKLVEGIAALNVVNSDRTGTLVPTNTGVPLRISGSL